MARDTSPTERRGYERPPIGDDWADAWDALVEDSDELAVERGPIADRPSTGAYDDALYLAVDQRTLWRWDAAASDWEAAAGLGTASDPVPGTSHFESVNTEESAFDPAAPNTVNHTIGVVDVRSGNVTLSDDESVIISDNFQNTRAGLVNVEAAGDSGVFSVAANINEISSSGEIVIGDTDGEHSLFYGSNSALTLRNRTGSEQGYRVFAILI